EIGEVAAGPDRVDIDDHQVALPDDLVGVPAAVGAGVAPGGDDDVVDEVEAAAVEVLVDLGADLGLAHPRLGPLVLGHPHRGVPVGGGDLVALQFVHCLHNAGLGHRGP